MQQFGQDDRQDDRRRDDYQRDDRQDDRRRDDYQRDDRQDDRRRDDYQRDDRQYDGNRHDEHRHDDGRRGDDGGFGTGFALPGADRPVVITWILLGINLAVWLLTVIVGGSPNQDGEVLLRFGAMFGPLIAIGEYWRFFTAMFLHAGLLHLFFNCFSLFIFGRLVEGVYGAGRFTVIYLLAGLSGGALSYMFNPTAIAVGASGAIFGILGTLVAFFVVHRNTLGEMGRRNLTGLLTIAGINLAIGLLIPNIDNWAHLGGLAGGFALGLAFAPRYIYEIVQTPFGTARRIIGRRRVGVRWLAVPVLAAVVVGLVWFSGADVSEEQQAQIFIARAERMLRDGDINGALSQAEQAVALDATNGRALFVRGKAMARLGATERARADLGEAIGLGLSVRDRQEAISLLVSLR